jgi:DNA mismatch endonuclease (patch repair protein)
MRANRSSDTKPEKTLRSSLWHGGLRGYRKNVRRLPGKPDIVYCKAKLAILVHGCYWHGCPTCKRNLTPKSNAVYWAEKIGQNKARDEKNVLALEELGFQVLVVWECELRQSAAEVVAQIRERLERKMRAVLGADSIDHHLGNAIDHDQY